MFRFVPEIDSRQWLHTYISDSVLRHDSPAAHVKVLLFTDRNATAVSSRPVPATSLHDRTHSPQWNLHSQRGMILNKQFALGSSTCSCT